MRHTADPMRHMTNEQIILGPLMQIARRYGVSIVHEESIGHSASASAVHALPGWSMGPMGDWLNIKKKTVTYNERSDPESVLHELTHVVLGTESLSNKSCESYVLFPFEWAMIRNVFRRVQRKDPIAARRFLRTATKYQDTTSVLDGSRYLADLGGRHGPLWKDAFRRAVEIGLLTESGHLTFAYPTWGRVRRVPPREWFARWESRS
jgi:hypothetical protein